MVKAGTEYRRQKGLSQKHNSRKSIEAPIIKPALQLLFIIATGDSISLKTCPRIITTFGFSTKSANQCIVSRSQRLLNDCRGVFADISVAFQISLVEHSIALAALLKLFTASTRAWIIPSNLFVTLDIWSFRLNRVS